MKTNVAHDTGPVPAHRLPEPPVRVRVLYVGGCGRSGSTLLDRMLGQVPGVLAIGEVVHIWRRGVGEDQLCGCGKAFTDCEFWSEVGDVAFGGWGGFDVRSTLRVQRR